MQYEHGGNVHRFLKESGKSAEEVLDFSANINPLGMSEIGKTKMMEAMAWLGHYPDPHYVILKEKMSAYYGVHDTQLSVFNGAAEGLHEIIRFLEPKRAIVPAPAFVEYEKALKGVQCEIEWFTLRALDEFEMNEQRFLITVELERPDLIVLCTPNNPTGKLLSIDFIEKVTELARRWKGNVLIDEAFFDFLPEHSKSAVRLTTLYNNLYVMKSFTKFFGVPGLRLGAIISSDEGFKEYVDTYGVPWRINAMAEHYALGAMEDKSYQDRTRLFIETEREWLTEQLKDMKDLQVFSSYGDYLLVQTTPEQGAKLEYALRKSNILIRNCSNYKGLGDGYYRIAVKNRSANERLIDVISKVLKS